ncbi:hypothetical protein HAL1_03547 [Halomonas sp. HAL1]|nr:hypothetical protein HAL1_03547 [Halomonas sp. HAL1]
MQPENSFELKVYLAKLRNITTKMVTPCITASVATPALKMLKFAIPEKDYINDSIFSGVR